MSISDSIDPQLSVKNLIEANVWAELLDHQLNQTFQLSVPEMLLLSSRGREHDENC